MSQQKGSADMAYEKREGDVSVFMEDKQGNDRRPDYKGTALINGAIMTVSLWVKKGRGGGEFLSGRIEPRRAQDRDCQQDRTPQRPPASLPPAPPRAGANARTPEPEQAQAQEETESLPF